MLSWLQLFFIILFCGISFLSALASHWGQAIFFLLLAGFGGLAILIIRNKSTYVMNNCTVFIPSDENKRDDNA